MTNVDWITKDEFLEQGFTETEWLFFSKYPRLFAVYGAYKWFTVEDVDIWSTKFNGNPEWFQIFLRGLCVHSIKNQF